MNNPLYISLPTWRLFQSSWRPILFFFLFSLGLFPACHQPTPSTSSSQEPIESKPPNLLSKTTPPPSQNLAPPALSPSQQKETSTPVEVFQGITLQIEERSSPRPLKLYWLEADFNVPGVEFEVSPPTEASSGEVDAATPEERLISMNWQAIMNGDAFRPLHKKSDLFPLPGTPLDLIGLAVFRGQAFSQPHPNYGFFYWTRSGEMGVGKTKVPPHTFHAVGGFQIILHHGRVIHSQRRQLHPRSAIGCNNATRKMYWLVVDGRQPGVSEGATLREMGQWMKERGAQDALNLDGGGSSFLALFQNNKIRRINKPVGLWDEPGTVRPVGNCVGLKAKPLPPTSGKKIP